ncbi:MAG: hypothetical protein KGH77_06220 [Candidatus Micrarchaeota archaeon]|nr:hypothetical protein [Candidatus Micrarchaeota archaeon]MDE1864988.1 hypothetical protein [Candidatus Micrarchaeota archaeon]
MSNINYGVVIAPKKYIDKFRQGNKEILKQAKLINSKQENPLILAFVRRSKEDKSITDSDMSLLETSSRNVKEW